jgi:hypothetical protein
MTDKIIENRGSVLAPVFIFYPLPSILLQTKNEEYNGKEAENNYTIRIIWLVRYKKLL